MMKSGEYKRAHPEKAREYNRRANEKRPDRDRRPLTTCPACGELKRLTWHSKRCPDCVREGRST